jgi:hypothetical protein
MIGLAIGLVIGALAGAVFGWWGGYRAGIEDGETGLVQRWPWSKIEERKGE